MAGEQEQVEPEEWGELRRRQGPEKVPPEWTAHQPDGAVKGPGPEGPW